MNMLLVMTLTSSMVSATPAIQDDPFGSFSHGAAYDAQPLLLAGGPDDRQDRRQERGRSDERQDKRECRQEEGRVGKDKRECKQEEVRDGVRGNRKSKDGNG